MAGIGGSQSAEIRLEVIPRGGSTAAAYRLAPAWECYIDGGRAAVPSTEATATGTLAAPAVPTQTAPMVASVLLIVTCAGNTTSISLVPQGESVDEASLAEGTCSITLQIYPCEDRAVVRVFDITGLQKKWKTTGLFAMCMVSEEELQSFTTEQIFGKEVVSFHVRKCEELAFPPFKLNFTHDFKCLKQLGEGTEGKIYECLSNFSNFACAVKEVVPSDLMIRAKHSEPSDVTLMVTLNHPNVVKMFLSWNGSGRDFFGRLSDVTFLCMMLSARTLSSYLDQSSTIELDIVNHIFQQIMTGLEYIHKHNVVHHDLKPENILMDDDLSLKITDYGIAAIKESPSSKINAGTIGSFPYAAPELNDAHKLHDEKADIFSCGIIYFEICTSYQRKRKVTEFSRRIRKAIRSWEPWSDFDLDAVLKGTDLLDEFNGNFLLLKTMLHPDDAKRPSATEILVLTLQNLLKGTDSSLL